MKVLVNAYACSPDMGSEPGMGWNWCVHLAKYCELHIITEGEFKDNIEKVLPTVEQGKNMHFYYLPIGGDDEKRSKKIRKRCWHQGDWRFYIDYAKWQKRALMQAREICEKQEIDILHQLNMIGFREPSYLWKLSKAKGIPLVWGPTNTKDEFPMPYLHGAPFRMKAFMWVKYLLTRIQLRTNYRVRATAKQASCVIAASGDSAKAIRKYWGIDSVVINETGCDTGIMVAKQTRLDDKFHLLWVGRFIFTKQLALAIKSVAGAFHHDMILHIVGRGNQDAYLAEAEKQGIADICMFHGVVNHDEVLKLMGQSDLFFFTSIMEGTSTVVMEAVQNGLPVLCFDTCGMSNVITDDVGMKVPLSTPNQSVKDFAEKIEYLYAHREVLARMSENCKKRAEELSWENKAKQMVGLYEKVIEELKVNVY
jgi:glycosyltransferase involved in cell wall biosynthesis